MSVIAFYQSLLDPYSDLVFILSIYRSEGVSPFFCVNSAHLLSILPMNCWFLYTFFSNIRQRAWFQWHRKDPLLPAVLVVSMFGVEALVILRSQLMDISVFSFRAYDIDRLMLRAKLFALYESLPQLLFQVFALVKSKGDWRFTSISLALSFLSILKVVAEGILSAASGDDEALPHYTYYTDFHLAGEVETLEVAPTETIAEVAATRTTGIGLIEQIADSECNRNSLPSWKILREIKFDVPHCDFEPHFGGSILKNYHTNAERLLLSAFSMNNLGILTGPELRDFMKATSCTPDDFREKALQFLKTFETDVVLGMRVLQPSKYTNRMLRVQFPLPAEAHSVVEVDVGRAEFAKEFRFDYSSLRLDLSEDRTVSRRLAKIHCRMDFNFNQSIELPFRFDLAVEQSGTSLSLLSCLPDIRPIVTDEELWRPPKRQPRWFAKDINCLRAGGTIRIGSGDVLQIDNSILLAVDFGSSPPQWTLFRLYRITDVSSVPTAHEGRDATEEEWEQLLQQFWPGFKRADPALEANLQGYWRDRHELQRLYNYDAEVFLPLETPVH
eukprot:Skav200151  [mRNA]  locus=scaffold2013:453211:455483:- [translate_table: standard]